jgi:hypothetical protein
MLMNMSLLDIWDRISSRYKILFYGMKLVGSLGIVTYMILSYVAFISENEELGGFAQIYTLVAILSVLLIAPIQEFTLMKGIISQRTFWVLCLIWFIYCVFFVNFFDNLELRIANFYGGALLYAWLIPEETFWNLRSWPKGETPIWIAPFYILGGMILFSLSYYPFTEFTQLDTISATLPYLIIFFLILFVAYLKRKFA